MKNTARIALCLVILLASCATAHAAKDTPQPLFFINYHFSQSGWNYVSLAYFVDPMGIRSTFCNASTISPPDDGNCTQVLFYNSSEKSWKTWDFNMPEASNTVNQVDNGWAYWVNVSQVGDTNGYDALIGDPITSEQAWSSMVPGWNSMMGWSNYSAKTISAAVSQIYTVWGKNVLRVWHYSDSNTDLTEPYWPENSAATFSGYDGYWDCVEDAATVGVCKFIEPPVMPWQNQRPTIESASSTVTPTSGEAGTTMFTFRINYTDADNEAASPAFVVIDGVPHAMTTADVDFTDGANYEYSTTLGWGEHKYYFNFSDGVNHVFYDGTNTTKYPKTVSYDSVATFNVTAVDSTAPSGVSGLQYSLTDVVQLYGFWYDGDGVPHYFAPEGTLNLTWNAATDTGSGIAYYKIYKDSVNIVNTTDLNFTERTSLGHEYKVSAVDNAGNEGPNATINITLNAGQPSPTLSPNTIQASKATNTTATQTVQAQLQPAPISGVAVNKIKQITPAVVVKKVSDKQTAKTPPAKKWALKTS